MFEAGELSSNASESAQKRVGIRFERIQSSARESGSNTFGCVGRSARIVFETGTTIADSPATPQSILSPGSLMSLRTNERAARSCPDLLPASPAKFPKQNTGAGRGYLRPAKRSIVLLEVVAAAHPPCGSRLRPGSLIREVRFPSDDSSSSGPRSRARRHPASTTIMSRDRQTHFCRFGVAKMLKTRPWCTPLTHANPNKSAHLPSRALFHDRAAAPGTG